MKEFWIELKAELTKDGTKQVFAGWLIMSLMFHGVITWIVGTGIFILVKYELVVAALIIVWILGMLLIDDGTQKRKAAEAKVIKAKAAFQNENS
tara:strand:- start:3084 stop:3365 length:282 start_codon:yes stop_codon:yes gene_type:complete